MEAYYPLFTTVSTPLPRDASRHKLLADNVPIALDIRDLHIWLFRQSTQFDIPSLGRRQFSHRVVVEFPWIARGDGKIRGGGKYSNHHHQHYHRHRRPAHPWSTSHSENAREAPLSWRAPHCRSGGRKRAGVGGGRRATSEVAGGQEIWLPIHSIAPRISNQFPRSIANHKEPEILRCRFGTKYFPWFLSDDRHAPLTSIGSVLVIFGYSLSRYYT